MDVILLCFECDILCYILVDIIDYCVLFGMGIGYDVGYSLVYCIVMWL